MRKKPNQFVVQNAETGENVSQLRSLTKANRNTEGPAHWNGSEHSGLDYLRAGPGRMVSGEAGGL